MHNPLDSLHLINMACIAKVISLPVIMLIAVAEVVRPKSAMQDTAVLEKRLVLAGFVGCKKAISPNGDAMVHTIPPY